MQHRQQSSVAEILFKKDTEDDLCITSIISIKI